MPGPTAAPSASPSPDPGPLSGISVIDLSTTLPGAMATQFLADAGADVLFVERPGGSAVRRHPGWPALGRGKRSRVLDLGDAGNRAELDTLLAAADVLVTTFDPGTLRRHGLTAPDLAAVNPRLVSAAITGWGSTGPWAHLKGYEGLVMAKLGYFMVKRRLAARPGPAFVSMPFASWGAAQSAVHGVLAALIEREASGAGQHVEADLVRGVHSLDTWQWFVELVGIRWPDAYQVVEAFDDDLQLQAPLIYPLLAAPTSDGVWLQFAQTEPRLFVAQMKELGLGEVFTDPKWAGVPVLPTQELRTELWETMIQRVSERSFAEWEHVFATNRDVAAEVFRRGSDVLSHPQLLHDERVVTIVDPEVGPVCQPSTLVHVEGRPLTSLRPAPRLDDTGTAPTPEPASVAPGEAPPQDRLPLEGVTIVEFGLMFAGPFGSTLLTDLGARVIKVESKEGDTIRRIQSFPESAGAKVMQGKESIALDLGTPEGLQIVHELVRRADVVLQSFRAGAAERAHVDRHTLKAINPDLVYVSAPGYGTDGPYGGRPAYAPSIGAASGLALTDAAAARGEVGSMDTMKRAAIQMYTGSAAVPLQADGIAALGVASAMLLGLLATARGRALPELTATMIATNTLANLDRLIDYPDKPDAPVVDEDYLGFSALYRLYPTAQGWVFLAAPEQREIEQLQTALGDEVDLSGERFATARARVEHDGELAEALAEVFLRRSAADWERDLTAAGVGCVQAYEGWPQALLQVDEQAAAEYTTTAQSPIFDEHLRLQPMVRFSRSRTQAKGFCLAGEHTDAILEELGHSPERIADLRARDVIA